MPNHIFHNIFSCFFIEYFFSQHFSFILFTIGVKYDPIILFLQWLSIFNRVDTIQIRKLKIYVITYICLVCPCVFKFIVFFGIFVFWEMQKKIVNKFV